ncbi:hypothetical protein HMPREF9144_1625 [Prevotella pallens ATCC 700821]|uniref:Uncharacterized protein n=1 Tax=Prevotella pallens ATCC 700821 TaxID=997353 RepID=F9DIY5_9BACT|nr:hypothetical protein HMPREF9144_1625 [Prevotella pallens ATCC 700821]
MLQIEVIKASRKKKRRGNIQKNVHFPTQSIIFTVEIVSVLYL